VGIDIDIDASGGGIRTSGLLEVGGQSSSYKGQSLSLTQLDSIASGTITIDIEDEAIISNNNAINIQGLATSLTLTAASGRITDAGNLTVTGEARFTANGDFGGVELGSPNNQFGSIFVLTSGDAIIEEVNDTQINSITAENLELVSGGNVTDSLNSAISITDSASIVATNGDVSLGEDVTQSVSFSALKLEARDISVVDTGAGITSLDIQGQGVNIQNSGARQIELIRATADNFALNTSGDIDSRINATITATEAVISGADVQLTNSSNISFASLDLTANSAALDHAGTTRLSGLDVATDFNLVSTDSVQGDPGALLTVGGVFDITAGGTGAVNLTGNFAGLNVEANTVDLALSSGTNIGSIVADGAVQLELGGAAIINDVDANSLNVSAGENSVTFGGLGLAVADAVTLEGGSIELGGGANSVGSFTATSTVTGGSIAILSDLTSDADISIAADIVRLGGGQRDITIATQGTAGLGSISVTDSEGGATGGTLFINSEVRLDTAAIQNSAGADITLLVGTDGVGEIGTEVTDDVATSLTLNAASGVVSLGDLSEAVSGANSLIDSVTIESASEINLNDLFVDGNTVTIEGAGNINAQGEISDTTGAVTLSTTGGNITLSENVSANGLLNLVADAGTLTAETANLSSNAGLNISTANNITLGGNVTVNSGDLSITSAAGSIAASNLTANAGNLSVRGSGQVTLNGATNSSGTVRLSSTTGSVVANNAVTSGTGLGITAGAGIEVNQIDVTTGDASLVAGTGDLKFNQSVNVTNGTFSAFSRDGGFEQSQDTLINAGSNIVISTQGGMKIASLRGGNNVSLLIRETDPDAGANFTRVNAPIDFGDNSRIRDIEAGQGSISFRAQVASVGSTDPDQNFVQRAETGGIYYGLVSGQFFSDDIGLSQVLVTAPAGAALVATQLTDISTGSLGDLAGSLFSADLAGISSNITASLAGTDSASSNAGQTSAASSSRSTAASQQDDEDEVAEVDEAAFQNLKNYDENPQGILLPEDQQFAYDGSGNLYFMMAMRTDSGVVQSVPFYKVDLSPIPTPGYLAESFVQNFVPVADTSWITAAGDD